MFSFEEKIKAVELVRGGLSYRAAAKLCNTSYESIRRWKHTLDEGVDALYALVKKKKGTKVRHFDIDKLPDDPEELKRIIFDMQFEIDLSKAVVDIVKKDPGVDPRTLPNKEKTILIDALIRMDQPYSIGWMMSSLRLAPATFYYHRKRIEIDPEKTLKERVKAECARHPSWGYRRIKYALQIDEKNPLRASEKRVRRIMAKEGLSVSRRRKNSRYSSYSPRKDSSVLPNIPLKDDKTHDFSAPAPNRLWLSDVTEFLLPKGERVFLSSVLDCFDGFLVSWQSSTSEKSEDLTDPCLVRACRQLAQGDKCTIHTDRGGHYHAESWKTICSQAGLSRSMSRKGHSPDNARMESFFGRLKMEFFDTRDWSDIDSTLFMEELDRWLVYYNQSRPKQSLSWKSPMQYRRAMGYAA